MNNAIVRQATVIVAVAATIVVNILAVTLPLNGLTTQELADRYEVYFVPAGYVFSIWSVIYLGLIAYAAYQALPAQRDNPRLQALFGPFLVSSGANIAWIFLWHYEQVVASLGAMLVLLGSLIVAYLRLGTGRLSVPPAERWAVRAVFSVYLGWVSVATIANATVVLDSIGWGGWGLSEVAWTGIMLAAGVVLAAAMALTRGDWLYCLVLVWAFTGIAVKFEGTDVARLALGAAAFVVVAAVVAWVRRVPPAAGVAPAAAT